MLGRARGFGILSVVKVTPLWHPPFLGLPLYRLAFLSLLEQVVVWSLLASMTTVRIPLHIVSEKPLTISTLAWSAPSAICTAGMGFGSQVGAEVTDFLFVLSEHVSLGLCAAQMTGIL